MPAIHTTEMKKGVGGIIYAVITLILIVGIPLQIFPYFWMVSNSFKNDLEIIKLPPTFIPRVFNFTGFGETFTKYHLWDNLMNTFILCGSIMLIQVSISAIAAFSLSKLRPRFGQQYLLFFIGTMMISAQALMFPLFIMMADLPIVHISLINNFWSYILASSAWGYTLFLFKGFFDGLPNELMEAAKIDGASNTTIFTQIALPLSLPVIAVNMLATFIAVYNDFMMPLLLLTSEKKWTIMVRIYAAQWGSAATWNNIMVMLTVSTIPVILVYIIAQKQVVQGISLTGLKG